EDGEGFGVAAVRNPQGPAAVIGAHGESYAAMGLLAFDGLLDKTFTGRPPERLGDSWLAVKAGLARGEIDGFLYQILDAADGNPKVPQAAQRLEHLEMYVLLGDPALRLPSMARDVEVTAKGPARAGAPLALEGKLPARLNGAKVRLTLERPADSEPAGLEPLPRREGDERDRVQLANHERSNRF